jgi:HD-GYP domain-containing protein (c-di-GMP phosphodiesterase class II)
MAPPPPPGGRTSSPATSHGAAAVGRAAVTTLPWSPALVVERLDCNFFYFFQHFKNVATFCKLLAKKVDRSEKCWNILKMRKMLSNILKKLQHFTKC